MPTNRSVLAIGIDAAESTLVRQMIEHDELPALRSLLAEGKWLEVRSPSFIGSGTVWPTFLTGEEPTAHGMYSEWKWLPATMNLRRYEGDHLTPFWKLVAQQGVTTGVFDVPFAPPVGIKNGFEVCEWWAHDSTSAGFSAGPEEIHSLVRESLPHPLSANRFVTATPDSKTSIEELAGASCEGVRLRGALARRMIQKTNPQLSVVVFPEIHHAGHQLWHTVAPDHPIYDGLERNGESLLKDLHRAIDEQIGELIRTTNADTVMVFALHGMRPALGFPAFLGPLLCERGFSQLENWRSQSWTSRALSVFAAVKRNTPAPLKKIYYQLTPSTATYKLARPTMLPAYDWKHTRAFSLPTDQYGWIRINLKGRESEGIVPAGEYEKLCRELIEMLSTLTSETGELLVEDITRTADAESALVNPLPDLVVHWRDAAYISSLKIKDSKVPALMVAKKSTGQHATPGFCIYRGQEPPGLDGVVAAKDLWRLIAAGLVDSSRA